MDNHRTIIELFKSIQGEGQWIGIPSLFIRFSKCNLTCPHCDTKFSWSEEGKHSTDEAIEFIKDHPSYQHVVITGGEPLLYQDDIIQILKSFDDRIFTIETNGTIIPKIELIDMMSYKGLWSVSPKLHLWDKDIFNVYRFFDDLEHVVQFKFVINDLNKDMERIRELLNRKLINSPLIVQPNGFREDYDVALREIADYINVNKLVNVRLLPQMHRICWGQSRRK